VTKQVSSKSVLEEDERKAAFPKDRERARRSKLAKRRYRYVCGAEASDCLEASVRLRWSALARRKRSRMGDAKVVEVGEAEAVDEAMRMVNANTERRRSERWLQHSRLARSSVSRTKAHKRSEKRKWDRGCLALDEARRGGIYTQSETIQDKYSTCRGE